MNYFNIGLICFFTWWLIGFAGMWCWIKLDRHKLTEDSNLAVAILAGILGLFAWLGALMCWIENN